MNRPNPLMVETWRGLTQSSQAQAAYFNCLLIQVAVVMLWWPKRTLSEALLNENPPDSLLAIVIAVGFTTAYYGLRIGTEEVLLAGQRPLKAWVTGTPLSVPSILSAYLAGRALQIIHALLLSSPLVFAVYSVGSGNWPALSGCIVAVIVQAMFYHLLGTLIYTIAGHHGKSVIFLSRAVLVLGYAGTFVLLPEASQVAISYELLTSKAWLSTSNLALPVKFVVLYLSTSIIVALLLLKLLFNVRRRSTPCTEVDNQKRDSHSHTSVDIRREH